MRYPVEPFEPEAYGWNAADVWYVEATDRDPDRGTVTHDDADLWWRYNVGVDAPPLRGMASPATAADVAAARAHFDRCVGQAVGAASAWRREEEIAPTSLHSILRESESEDGSW